ncbi:hypothetical protein [Nocardioides speluncae]|uniref:hypothetical protein n=1 Tax=Nocardioides speluncae TaxID=2670337 RepID=UPI000D69C8C1|nr:hypothetical protein [Nocardioides speluncae]
MTSDDVRAMQAADPYAPSRVALDLDAEGRELMEEIMSTTKEKTPLRAHPLLRRHGRWVLPVAAAAAVAAVVAGGVVIRGGDDGAGPANPGPASSVKADPKPGLEKNRAQAKPPKADPGLPPTPENLYHVVLNDGAWQISNLNNDEVYGGSLSWSKGKQALQVTWYPASEYQSYLADRRDIGPARDATVLGQQGEAFHQAIDLKKSGDQSLYVETEPTLGPDGEDPGNNLRVMTVLPPVGDFFLEFDASVIDEAEYDAVMAQLSRVNGQAWNAVIDRATVTPGEGQAFLDQAGQGVPLPQGMTVTVADLELPQSDYHARASFASKVLCGWAQRYIDGDDAALDTLQGSADWAVLQAMDDGDYADVTADLVQELADDRTFDSWRQGWGCA